MVVYKQTGFALVCFVGSYGPVEAVLCLTMVVFNFQTLLLGFIPQLPSNVLEDVKFKSLACQPCLLLELAENQPNVPCFIYIHILHPHDAVKVERNDKNESMDIKLCMSLYLCMLLEILGCKSAQGEIWKHKVRRKNAE